MVNNFSPQVACQSTAGQAIIFPPNINACVLCLVLDEKSLHYQNRRGLMICTVSRAKTSVMITVFNEIHLQLSSDTFRGKKYTPCNILNKKKNADITIAGDHNLRFLSCLTSLTGRGHHTFHDFFSWLYDGGRLAAC